MADANLPPLVTDYEVEWLNPEPGELSEGEHYEHGWIHLDNGYVVSLIRQNVQYESLGFGDGHWEATIGKPVTPGSLWQILGLAYEPTPELADLLPVETEDMTALAGPFDSAGVNSFVATVSQRPKAVAA